MLNMVSLLLKMHFGEQDFVCKQVAIRLRMFVLNTWNQYEVLSKRLSYWKAFLNHLCFCLRDFWKPQRTLWCPNTFKNVFDGMPPGKSFSVTAHFPSLQISALFPLYKNSNIDLCSFSELRMKRNPPHTQSIKGGIFWPP